MKPNGAVDEKVVGEYFMIDGAKRGRVDDAIGCCRFAKYIFCSYAVLIEINDYGEIAREFIFTLPTRI